MMYLYMHTMQKSVLSGRLEPCGQVEGFTVEVAASGSSSCLACQCCIL